MIRQTEILRITAKSYYCLPVGRSRTPWHAFIGRALNPTPSGVMLADEGFSEKPYITVIHDPFGHPAAQLIGFYAVLSP
jgi:hypothetical protein